MVQIIVNDDGVNSASLAEKLDKLVAAKSASQLKGFVIFNNGDPEKLKQMAAAQNINGIGIIYLKDKKDTANKDIFGLLKINPAAKNTVLVYKKKTIAATFVDLDAAKFGAVEEAVGKMLQ